VVEEAYESIGNHNSYRDYKLEFNGGMEG